MATPEHHFTLGDIACSIISDGSLACGNPAHLFLPMHPTLNAIGALRTAGIEPNALA
jgi:hypothetical protein